MGVTTYLGDKSALARLHIPQVSAVLLPLMDRGLVFLCAATRAEMLYSARNLTDRHRVSAQLDHALCWARTPDDLWERLDEIQVILTEKGQHRAASIPDLIVAATADALGLSVLHYDSDFDTIAAHTGQSTEWVVPAGAV